MRFLQDSSSPSLETETLLGATFSKIFAWSQADVCESDHRLIVMIKTPAMRSWNPTFRNREAWSTRRK